MADKHGATVADIADEVAMREIKEGIDIGTRNESQGVAKGIDAKFRIASILDLEINSVNLLNPDIVYWLIS